MTVAIENTKTAIGQSRRAPSVYFTVYTDTVHNRKCFDETLRRSGSRSHFKSTTLPVTYILYTVTWSTDRRVEVNCDRRENTTKFGRFLGLSFDYDFYFFALLRVSSIITHSRTAVCAQHTVHGKTRSHKHSRVLTRTPVCL